jgi:hypothetical protein
MKIMENKQTAVEWWKLLVVFVSAIVLEANSIAGLRFLIDENWIGMVMMVGINPFLCLPMNHYTIEVKTFKQRALIALAFSLGFAVGVITIRPFFI